MNKMWLSGFTDADMTLAGLFIFLVFFVGVNIWVFRKNSKSLYKDIANLPFESVEANQESL